MCGLLVCASPPGSVLASHFVSAKQRLLFFPNCVLKCPSSPETGCVLAAASSLTVCVSSDSLRFFRQLQSTNVTIRLADRSVRLWCGRTGLRARCQVDGAIVSLIEMEPQRCVCFSNSEAEADCHR